MRLTSDLADDTPESSNQLPENYPFARTDDAGRFTIDTVKPGKYKAYAWENIENGAWADPAFLQQFENAAKSVTLADSDNGTIDLRAISIHP